MRIITGMHRSGTSLVARLFHEAGADMGDPDTFHTADRWNPDGYFEQPDIHDVNMPLIHGPWGRASYLLLPSEATIARRAAKMSDRIERIARAYDDRVVKECRFCLTMQAWIEHGTRVEAVVICVRPPEAVARSLKKRNKIPLRLGLRLWRQHTERLLAAVGDRPTWIVSYDELFVPSGFRREMLGAFELFGVEVSEEQLDELAARCVKPQLRHNRRTDTSYPDAVAATWDRLMAQRRRQFGGDRPAEDGQPRAVRR